MNEKQEPLRPEQPADDHLLEDLSALTGLFNPEQIWREEELLDDMERNDKQVSKGPAESA